MGKTCEQFKEFRTSRKCRFCYTKLSLTYQNPRMNNSLAFRDVCSSKECEAVQNASCSKVHKCGHYCCGFKDEKKCLPCLQEECVKKDERSTLGVNADEFCTICYTSLGCAPCVIFECKHILHMECVMPTIK